jgi:hypothetical protein
MIPTKFRKLAASAALVMVLGTGGAITFAPPPPAVAQGVVPPDLKKGVDDSIASVKALGGLAIVCLTVALSPIGAMLTLKFLNMILNRV